MATMLDPIVPISKRQKSVPRSLSVDFSSCRTENNDMRSELCVSSQTETQTLPGS